MYETITTCYGVKIYKLYVLIRNNAHLLLVNENKKGMHTDLKYQCVEAICKPGDDVHSAQVYFSSIFAADQYYFLYKM